MRMVVAVLVAAATFWGGAAVAEPSEQCGALPVAAGTDGSMSASVCVQEVGALTAAVHSQQGLNYGGYAVLDGDSNSIVSPVSWCLAGYFGVQEMRPGLGGQGLVFAPLGDYSYPAGFYLPTTGITSCLPVGV
jgi:hypothetical protein